MGHSYNIFIGVVLSRLEKVQSITPFSRRSESSDLSFTILNEKLYFEPYTNDQNIILKHKIHVRTPQKSRNLLSFLQGVYGSICDNKTHVNVVYFPAFDCLR